MKRANWSFPLQVKKIPLFLKKRPMALITNLEGGWTKERRPRKEQPCTLQCRWGVHEPLSPQIQTHSHALEQATHSETFEPSACTQKIGRAGPASEKQLQRGFGWAKDRGKPEPVPFHTPLATAWWHSTAGKGNVNMGNGLLFRGKKHVLHARHSPWCMTKVVLLTMILQPLHN